MATSIYDVAKQAGVSISTVSRVLNGSAGVRPQKVEAVRHAIEKLQYAPNTMARGLATRSSGLVGITSMFNFYDATYTMQLLKGFIHYVDATQYSVVLINDPGGESVAQSAIPAVCIDHIDRNRIDALFYVGVGRPSRQDPTYKKVIETQFPFAYIGPLPSDGVPNPANILSVYAQLETYIYDVVKHFAAVGHKRIGFFICNAPGQRDLLAKVIARVQQDFDVDVQLYCMETQHASKDIQLRNAVDAVVRDKRTALYVNSLYEMGQILTALQVRGIQVPEDLSICAVEHARGEGEAFGQGIDCVYVPAFDMGYTGARLLFEYMNGEISDNGHIVLNSEYIPRNSVRPPR